LVSGAVYWFVISSLKCLIEAFVKQLDAKVKSRRGVAAYW